MSAKKAECVSREGGLLRRAGVRVTRKRKLVLAAVLDAGCAVPPGALLDEGGIVEAMDRATLYRILDLLAEKGLVAKTLGPDRTFRYCAGGGLPQGEIHSHFFCLRCGLMRCLPAAALTLDESLLPKAAAVGHVEVRVDGVCGPCRDAGK